MAAAIALPTHCRRKPFINSYMRTEESGMNDVNVRSWEEAVAQPNTRSLASFRKRLQSDRPNQL
jgi:hypothetical protein